MEKGQDMQGEGTNRYTKREREPRLTEIKRSSQYTPKSPLDVYVKVET